MNLTENEIHILKSIKSNTEKITKEFGLIKLAQINIKKREQDAISMLDTLRNEEKQVVEVLEKKLADSLELLEIYNKL